MTRVRNETMCNTPITGDYAYSVKEHYRHATCKECGRSGLIWRRNANGRYILTTHESGDFHDCIARRSQAPVAPVSGPAPTPTQAPIDIDAITRAVLAQLPAPTIDYDSIVVRTRALIEAQTPTPITIEPYNAPSVTIENPHPALERVLRYVSRRRNVWLYGPAGTGKTTAAKLIAQALGLPYYVMSMGPMTQEYGIFGYRSADGTFIPGPLFKPYTEGGIFVADEMDGASADASLCVNAATANGECMFGGVMYAKHPDFVFIATANTVGNGASREYVGRSQLDAATLDRFVMVEWDYDSHLERRIAQSYAHPDALRWYEYVLSVRRAIDSFTDMRLIVSTRAIVNGCEALSAGIAWDDVADDIIWNKTDSDTVARIKASLR